MNSTGRAAVVGSPIEHSLSPVLHLAAYEALGLAWEYGRIEIARGELTAFVAELDDLWRGLSVTMPLKEEALELADWVDDVALVTQVANTLVSTEAGVWRAFNTDVFGIVESIRQAAPGRIFPRVLILGSGATARSAAVAAGAVGAEEVTIAGRSPEPMRRLADLVVERGMRVQSVGIEPTSVDVDLVISTLPADAAAPWCAEARALADAVLLDVTYAPWPTSLARAWSGPVARGADMLLWQATEQVRLMTGLPAPVDAMRDALARYPQG